MVLHHRHRRIAPPHHRASAAAAMEEIDELRAKAIASMLSVVKVKSPATYEGELPSMSSPANPSSSPAAKIRSPVIEHDGEFESSSDKIKSPDARGEGEPASVPSAANPSPSEDKDKLLGSREEGELSSGEEPQVLPTCSTVPTNCMTVDEPIAIAPRDATTQINDFPNSVSCPTNKQLPVSITRNYSKHLKAKHVPFKSTNRRDRPWHGKASDDNLVIRFSKDDSGSDSEDSNAENSVSRRANREVTVESPVTSTRTQQKVLPRPLTNRTKPALNKFVSSTTDGCGSSYRKPVASSTEMDPQVRLHTSIVKPSTSQEHEHIQDAHLADHKVERLRHQIAVKENQLKAYNKSTIQSKGSPANSFGDQQRTGFRRPAFVTTSGVMPKEQAVKRLKLDGLPKSSIFSDEQLQKPLPSTRFISEFYKDTHAVDRRECEQTLGSNSRSGRRHSEANRDGGIPSDSFLNRAKHDDSLALMSSEVMSNYEVPPRPNNYSFAAEVSCESHQFGMRANPADNSQVQNEILSPKRMRDNANDGALCLVDSHRKKSSESLRPSNIGAGFSNLLPDKATSIGGVHLEPSNKIFNKRSVHVGDPQLVNGDVNISAMESMDLESLVKLEELQDNELAQAQELRRRCEFEERRALKTYRDAQRALVDANKRCTRLYRKRELFSAQLRSLTMEDSSSWWPSSWQNQKETALDSVKAAPVTIFGLLPSLGHQILAGQASDCSGCDYNDGCPDGAYQQNRDLGLDQCQEPNADRSAQRAANDICAMTIMSGDEDDMNFSFDRRSVESRLADNVNTGYEGGNMNAEGGRPCSGEISQDYELLEATLRSKLVARLGARTPSKINDVPNAECNGEKGEDTTGEKNSSFEQQQVAREDMEGPQCPGSQLTLHFNDESHCNTSCIPDEPCRDVDPAEDNSFPMQFCWSSETDLFSCPSSKLQIVSRFAKFILPGLCNRSSMTKERGHMSSGTVKESSDLFLNVGEGTEGFSSRSPSTGELESSVCDVAIDPFRPFCMFELRGKCNNEECPWQHVKGSTKGNIKCNNRPVTASSDGWASHPLTCGNCNALCQCHKNLQVPTYTIGSDHINIDLHLPGPVLARSNLRYWQRELCASFPLPCSVEKVLPHDASLLQSDACPVADDYSRKGHFLCFRSQDGSMEQLKEGLPVSEQSLEMALALFDGEKAYKSNRKKALALISRALEKDPTSVVSWIVYLHIYYGKEKRIGKDDLFHTAVHQNGDSYDLWLLYINSRLQLGDRLDAYDFALTSLCRRRDTCDKDGKYTSACILDIFLQMVDFLCMSGNVEKAISECFGAQFENSGDTLFSRVHSHLIVSDKCIFWFCCIYVVIYGKLPDSVVQKFEFEKDPSIGIEWPCVQLPIDRKDRALELMKASVDSMTIDVDTDFDTSDQTDVRSLHFLAICHIKCVAALEGLRSSADLVVKYMKLYPLCVELVLMSARLQNYLEDNVLQGFEEALCNWPTEIPGCQCIWNQYAEHLLESKGYEEAEKLLSRWFQGYWKGKYPCTENTESVEDVPTLQSNGSSDSRMADDAFGFLNLFLHRMLQKDIPAARVAIEKALKLATPMDFEHCVREHAAFMFSTDSDSQGVSRGLLCRLLTGYLGDHRATCSSNTLSRRFYPTIKKLRIRKWVDNILGTFSEDFSIMNSALEACYGSSLIPENFGEQEDIVDLVEFLMERMPGNYELALSVYRSICRKSSHTGIRFWASSVLVNSILQAVPVAPERIWLEAAHLLRNLDKLSISLRFHQQALSVYRFSIKLWQSYLDLSRITGNSDAIVEAARQQGVELAQNLC